MSDLIRDFLANPTLTPLPADDAAALMDGLPCVVCGTPTRATAMPDGSVLTTCPACVKAGA